MYMGWGQERASPGRLWQAWKPTFIALKGADIFLFDVPPVSIVSVKSPFIKLGQQDPPDKSEKKGSTVAQW